MTTEIITDISEAEQGSSLWHDAWLRLRKNRLALFGGITLVLFIIIGDSRPAPSKAHCRPAARRLKNAHIRR